MIRRASLFPLALAFSLAAACAKPAVRPEEPVAPAPAPRGEAPKPVASAPPPVEEAPVESPAVPAPVAPAAPPAPSMPTVRFAYNSWYLEGPARQVLADYVASVRKGGRPKLVIEGHADERGTAEYNLVLGERRASAVRKYLANLGLDAKRIRTISFGENRPADERHDEGAWAANRRAEVKAGPK